MAKRKLAMNKRPARPKLSNDSSCLKTLLLLPFLLIKGLYESAREGISSETPEENAGCGCLMILLLIVLGYSCYLLFYKYKGPAQTDDNRIPVELLKQYNEKTQ